jgi:hypothetical protein
LIFGTLKLDFDVLLVWTFEGKHENIFKLYLVQLIYGQAMSMGSLLWVAEVLDP